jgi:hypothetical protein
MRTGKRLFVSGYKCKSCVSTALEILGVVMTGRTQQCGLCLKIIFMYNLIFKTRGTSPLLACTINQFFFLFQVSEPD